MRKKRRPHISKDLRIDAEISAPKLRVVLEDGTQLGVISLEDARKKAEEMELNLVEVGPNVDPPVCRIMDYGKFRFEQKKRDREIKKRQNIVLVKELTMGPSIEQHDYEVKLKKAREFISGGHRLRLTIRFRGRQILHKEKGEDVLRKFENDLLDVASVDRGISVEGRKMSLQIQPKKTK